MKKKIKISSYFSSFFLERVSLPISRFCLSTSPDIIGNICKLERDECAAGCGRDVLLERFRALPELNEGDVFTESVSLICAAFSGTFNTAFEK